MKAKETARPPIPFALTPDGDKTRQMVEGIRSAIETGHWKSGDILPSAAQFQKILGTGGYVPRTALRQLAEEGRIVLKRHVGAVVVDCPHQKALGRIAFIASGHRESYYENVHAFSLQRIFEQAGYEMVHIVHAKPDDESEDSDFRPLRTQLSRGLAFAICLTESHKVADMLDAANVPYVNESGSGRNFPNALAVIDPLTESQAAFNRLAEGWKASHVRNVVIIDFEHDMPRTLLSAFLASGIAFRRLVIRQPKDERYLQGIQQAGLNAVSQFFKSEKNRREPPDALFFYDDYLASGGLVALAATSLRVPEDIRIATIANRGRGPVWFKPLTRLEFDPVGNARLIGDYVLKSLAGKDATPPSLTLKFIKGAT